MSKLYYITSPRKFELSDELKRVLVSSKTVQPGVDINIDTGAAEYFRGLRDAGVDGAQKVLDALSEHKKLTLIVEKS